MNQTLTQFYCKRSKAFFIIYSCLSKLKQRVRDGVVHDLRQKYRQLHFSTNFEDREQALKWFKTIDPSLRHDKLAPIVTRRKKGSSK